MADAAIGGFMKGLAEGVESGFRLGLALRELKMRERENKIQEEINRLRIKQGRLKMRSMLEDALSSAVAEGDKQAIESFFEELHPGIDITPEDIEITKSRSQEGGTALEYNIATIKAGDKEFRFDSLPNLRRKTRILSEIVDTQQRLIKLMSDALVLGFDEVAKNAYASLVGMDPSEIDKIERVFDPDTGALSGFSIIRKDGEKVVLGKEEIEEIGKGKRAIPEEKGREEAEGESLAFIPAETLAAKEGLLRQRTVSEQKNRTIEGLSKIEGIIKSQLGIDVKDPTQLPAIAQAIVTDDSLTLADINEAFGTAVSVPEAAKVKWMEKTTEIMPMPSVLRPFASRLVREFERSRGLQMPVRDLLNEKSLSELEKALQQIKGGTRVNILGEAEQQRRKFSGR